MVIVPPHDSSLSASQLARLAGLGEERTARIGDVLFKVGDASYTFIAIVEGEVAVYRHDRQGARPPWAVYLPRRAEPSLPARPSSGRWWRRSRCASSQSTETCSGRCCSRMPQLSDLVLSTFIARREALQRVEGIGIEIFRPALVRQQRCGCSTSPSEVERPHRCDGRTRGRPLSMPSTHCGASAAR